MNRRTVILAYPKVDHEQNYVYFWMPFSVLSIAKTLLDSSEVNVVIFDGNQQGDPEWLKLLEEHAGKTACIGFSIMTGGGQIAHALRLAQLARDHGNCPPLVFGGPHVNVLAGQTVLHPLVDGVLMGPGQTSMPAFVEALAGLRSFEDVPGLMFKHGGEIVCGPVNPPRVQDLGGYPWHLVDAEKYVRDDPTVATRTLNFISSLGCVYKCRFCYELTYNRKYSRMSSDDLLDEIEWLVNTYRVNGIKFYDADWFVDIRRAAAFAQGLIERDLKIQWAASINPNDILRAARIQPDLLPLLAESGCTRLLMGVESGSDRVLEQIVNKEISRAQILDVAQAIAAHGILGSYTFIVGFPGETDAEQDETYQLIQELWEISPTPETRVHIFAPYPGTPLYEVALRHGFVPPERLEDWARYDYYQSQTPWTSDETAKKARAYTRMRLSPSVFSASVDS